MFIHTRSSAPKRFAKFGWHIQPFCHKKVQKAVAKLESDRLYSVLSCWLHISYLTFAIHLTKYILVYIYIHLNC